MEEAGGYVRVFGGHGLRHPCVAEISVAGNYPENDHQPGEGPRAAGNSAAAALAVAFFFDAFFFATRTRAGMRHRWTSSRLMSSRRHCSST